MKKPSEDKSSLSVEEAGQKGGEATKKRYGRDYYSKIGQKGGETVSRNREHMKEIGRRGGLN